MKPGRVVCVRAHDAMRSDDMVRGQTIGAETMASSAFCLVRLSQLCFSWLRNWERPLPGGHHNLAASRFECCECCFGSLFCHTINIINSKFLYSNILGCGRERFKRYNQMVSECRRHHHHRRHRHRRQL